MGVKLIFAVVCVAVAQAATIQENFEDIDLVAIGERKYKINNIFQKALSISYYCTNLISSF